MFVGSVIAMEDVQKIYERLDVGSWRCSGFGWICWGCCGQTASLAVGALWVVGRNWPRLLGVCCSC